MFATNRIPATEISHQLIGNNAIRRCRICRGEKNQAEIAGALEFDEKTQEVKWLMKRLKAISKYLLAGFMVIAGITHFLNPAFFLKIMPPWLPLHSELVFVSGVAEVLLGVALLLPRYSRLAAWGIMALLLAVFPANIYLYQNQQILPAPPVLHLLRLPLQFVFLLWAFWHTGPQEQEA